MDLIINALLALLIAYYFYRKSIKEPIACYSIHSLNVIGDYSSSGFGEKIAVSYGNNPIPRLSVTTVTFWNGGNSPLKHETLLPRYQPRISINPDGKILEATIITNPNPECECKILSDPDAFPNTVLLNFGFLDQGNGVVVQVLHTGRKEGISVVGKLKGVRLENACVSAKKYDSISEFINYSGWVLLAAMLFIFTVLVQFHTWIGLPPAFLDSTQSNSSIISKSLLGLSLIMMLSHILLSFLKKTTSHRIPKELRDS